MFILIFKEQPDIKIQVFPMPCHINLMLGIGLLLLKDTQR